MTVGARGRAAAAILASGVMAGFAAAAPSVVALPGVRRRYAHRMAGFGRADHVALTFDDGPDPASTPSFLQTLDRLGWKATFFMLGEMVEASPGLAAEVAAAGHEIALHGYTHRSHLLRSPRSVIEDMSRAGAVIEDATGASPTWLRPPFGHVATATLVGARRLGVPVVLWTTWGHEWARGATAQSVSDRVARDLTPGGTILLHDSDCTSPPGSAAAALGALDRLVETFTTAGVQPGPLCDHGVSASSGPSAGQRP